MATFSNAITYARQLIQTDSNGLSDTLGIAFGNDALENVHRIFYEHGLDVGMTNEVTIPITGATSYTFPNGTLYSSAPSMFALKTISVNPTGSNQQDYLQAEKLDVSNLQGKTSVDFLRLNQATYSPLFDNKGDSFEIFPTLTSGNIKIIYWKLPAEYTATSDTILYPVSLDFRMLGARMAALYALSQEGDQRYPAFDGEFSKRLKDLINILAPASQQPVKPEKLHISGWEF